MGGVVDGAASLVDQHTAGPGLFERAERLWLGVARQQYQRPLMHQGGRLQCRRR